jgi:hypothetical protein
MFSLKLIRKINNKFRYMNDIKESSDSIELKNLKMRDKKKKRIKPLITNSINTNNEIKFKKKNRKSVYIKLNNVFSRILSVGIIIYRIKNKSLDLLLINRFNKYEEINSFINDDYINIYDTISKQCVNESNYILDYDSIQKRLNDTNTFYIYNKYPKHIIYIIRATKDEGDLISESFDDYGHYDNNERKIEWVSSNEFTHRRLNYKLRNKNLFSYINYLQKKIV